MISNFKHLVKLSMQVVRKCELRSFYNEGLFGAFRCDFCLNNQKLNFHTGMPRMKFSPEEEQKKAARSVAKSEGVVQSVFEGDLNSKRKEGYFPTVELPDTLFGGIPFKELPIVNIRATRNNTHLRLTDQGFTKIIRSCGMEGFKNTRKGTNIAGQTVGTSFGFRAVRRGYKYVRVIVEGLGPGRLSAIKGLQLSGLNVVSITDKTIDIISHRPRKQKRL